MPTLPTPSLYSRRLHITIVGLLTLLLLTSCSIPPAQPDDTPTASPSAASSPVNARGLRSATVPMGNPEILSTVNPHLPTTITDAKGGVTTITTANRILALDQSGALAASVYALGLGDRLVGRDISTDFPASQSLPLVTPAGHSINAEAVLNLSPDLILTDGTIGPVSVLRQLAASGVTVVYTSDNRNLGNAEQLLSEIAHIFGDDSAGTQAAHTLRTRIDTAINDAKQKADGRRMLILYLRGTTTSMIAGPKSGGPELITSLGGVDAGAGLGLSASFTPLTAEALVKAAPDTIILMQKGFESVGGLAGLHHLPGFDQTPAGRTDSVLTVPDTHLLSFGPDSASVVTAMATALYSTP